MSKGFGIAGLQLYTSDPSIPGANPISYIITDHNRSPIQISYERVENSSRMANGTLRRFITANKKKVNSSWSMVPAAGGYSFTADGNLGGAWLKSFFEENVYNPIWIKLTYADEAWRFQNTVSNPDRTQATNQTFNRTAQNTGVQNTFQASSVAFGAFSSGVSTASVYTVTPHNFSASSEVMISGVNQLFNGTWITTSSVSSSVFTFQYAANNNASANFKINSYVQSGASVIFNIDNNDFLQTNASVVVANVKNNTGNSIDGIWKIVSKTGQTSFVATNADLSQTTGTGQYGDATILSSASYLAAVNAQQPLVTGPIISSDILKVFITNFTYNINKRLTLTDYVDMSIEFTEI